jgi:hypothetical protein
MNPDHCRIDYISATPPARRQWHCYHYFNGSVLKSDVEAATAEDAAVLAASQHKIPGKWTVVPGDAVTVDIAITTQYIVRGPTS